VARPLVLTARPMNLRTLRKPPRTSRPFLLAAICALVICIAAVDPARLTATGFTDCEGSLTTNGPPSLTAGLGPEPTDVAYVNQGEGSLLSGTLTGSGIGIPGAFLCVYSRVLTESEVTLIGIAVTRPDGDYRFAVPPGPSRSLTVVAQFSQNPQSASAKLRTRVRPSLLARPNSVRHKHWVRFSGHIPGPDNNKVTVVLQGSAKSGIHWFDFRHGSTYAGGQFSMRYFFGRSPRAIIFLIRAQVLGAPGYPYEAGYSRQLRLRVLP
jgi:hypothetical protein